MMSDAVDERNVDILSASSISSSVSKQRSHNTVNHELLSPKISKSYSVAKSMEGLVQIIAENLPKDNNISFHVSDTPEKIIVTDHSTMPVMSTFQKKPRSACWARSRDSRKCQMHFREMIDKQETRNEELEHREGDLRGRLDMLECSMPAVMVWNILRMTQGSSPTTIRRLLEKQFKAIHHADNIAIPITASQHYDCRIRDIEAERKEALRRAEEARALLADKEAAVEERQKLLAEAKKCNQEKMERMEKLNRDAHEMRLAMENAKGDDRSCVLGECGEIRCNPNLLDKVGSLSSICSTDLECFAKLQALAESEVCMKRQISELERREEAYMRTLQQADELWSEMESDSIGTLSKLQEQLSMKTTANQQLAGRICQLEDELEKSKRQLIGCKDALNKFSSKEYVNAEIGFDDGEAGVMDREIVAAVQTATTFVSVSPETVDKKSSVHPQTVDQESSIAPESTNEGVNVHTKMFDKESAAIVDQMEREVDRPTGLGIDASMGDSNVNELDDSKSEAGIPQRPESHDPKKIQVEYGDIEELPEEQIWDWDEGCAPSVICKDPVDTNVIQPPITEATVTTSQEMEEQAVEGPKPGNRDEIVHEFQIMENVNPSSITESVEGTKPTAEPTLGSDHIILSREELRNWYNIVDSVHHTITVCVNCSSKTNLTAQLAENMRDHLSTKALADGIEPKTHPELSESLTYLPKVPTEILPESGHVPSGYRTSSPLLPVAATHLGIESVALPGDDALIPDPNNEMELPRGEIEAEDISIVPSSLDSSVIIPKSESYTTKLTKISDEFPGIIQSQMNNMMEDPAVAARTSHGTPLQVTHQFGKTEGIKPFVAEIKDYEEKSLASSMPVDKELHGSVIEKDISNQTSNGMGTHGSILDTTEELPELVSHASEASMGVISSEHVEKTLSDKPQDEVRPSSNKSEITIPIQQEVEVGLELSTSRLELPIDIPAHEAEIQQLVKDDEMSLEHGGDLNETTVSPVIARTTPFLESEVKSERSEPTPPLLDVTDDPQLVSAPDRIPQLTYLPESKVHTEIDAVPPIEGDKQSVYEGILEAIIENLPVPRFQELPMDEVPVGIEKEYKKPSVTTSAEDEQHKNSPSSAVEVESAMESEEKPELSVVRPMGIAIVGSIIKVLLENIHTEQIRTEVSERAKLQTDEELRLPISVDPCIFKLPPCHLLVQSECPGAMSKITQLDSEGTQTFPQVPRTLDSLKLNTVTRNSWLAADLVMYRRQLVWSRRSKDKSTLTTVCADTQTDSTPVGTGIMRQRISGKDDRTCSSVGPQNTGFGRHEHLSYQRTSGRSPAHVGLAVAELFGSPRLQPSTARTMEKETSVIKHGRKSPLEKGSDLHCAECGSPITPEGTPLSPHSSLRTITRPQKSLIKMLTKMATSSTTNVGKKKNVISCCECKTSGKVKTTDESHKKKELEKSLNGRTRNENICCPSPSEDDAKVTTAMSKSRKSKRKPEKKDQSVMARIPTSKLRKIKENIIIDNSLMKVSTKGKAKDSSKDCYASWRLASKVTSSSWATAGSLGAECSNRISSTKQSGPEAVTTAHKIVPRTSSHNNASKCGCDEDSSIHIPCMKYSSMFRSNTIQDETACNCGIGESQTGGFNDICNCSSIKPVSREEHNCNCADLI